MFFEGFIEISIFLFFVKKSCDKFLHHVFTPLSETLMILHIVVKNVQKKFIFLQKKFMKKNVPRPQTHMKGGQKVVKNEKFFQKKNFFSKKFSKIFEFG